MSRRRRRTSSAAEVRARSHHYCPTCAAICVVAQSPPRCPRCQEIGITFGEARAALLITSTGKPFKAAAAAPVRATELQFGSRSQRATGLGETTTGGHRLSTPVPVEALCRHCGLSWAAFWRDASSEGHRCPQCEGRTLITDGIERTDEERWLAWNRGELPLTNGHRRALRLQIGQGPARIEWAIAWPVMQQILREAPEAEAGTLRKLYRARRAEVTKPVRYRDLESAERTTLSRMRSSILPAICSGPGGAPGEGSGPFRAQRISEEWTELLALYAEGRKRRRRKKKLKA